TGQKRASRPDKARKNPVLKFASENPQRQKKTCLPEFPTARSLWISPLIRCKSCFFCYFLLFSNYLTFSFFLFSKKDAPIPSTDQTNSHISIRLKPALRLPVFSPQVIKRLITGATKISGVSPIKEITPVAI